MALDSRSPDLRVRALDRGGDAQIRRRKLSAVGSAVISTRADAVAVGRVLGERALGLYTVAFRLPELLIDMVCWSISLAVFPALSRQRATERTRLPAAVLKLLRFQALHALPMAAGIAVLASPLIVVLFSSTWEPASGVLSAIAVMAGVSAVAFPIGDLFKAVARQRVLLLINLAQIPVLVAVVIAVAPHGIVAVAWARAGSKALFSAIMIGFAARIVGISFKSVVVAMAPA